MGFIMFPFLVLYLVFCFFLILGFILVRNFIVRVLCRKSTTYITSPLFSFDHLQIFYGMGFVIIYENLSLFYVFIPHADSILLSFFGEALVSAQRWAFFS